MLIENNNLKDNPQILLLFWWKIQSHYSYVSIEEDKIMVLKYRFGSDGSYA